MTELHDAWDELFAAIPDALDAGKPLYNPGSHAWEMYAFDQRERLKVGHRTRACTAVAPTEELVVFEMARCLREIGAGRVPK